MNQDKANCISVKSYHSDMDLICVAQRGRTYRGEPQHFEPSADPNKTNSLTTVAKDNLILQKPRGKNQGGVHVDKSPTLSANAWQQNNLVVMKDKNVKQLNPSRESGGTQPRQQNRVYDVDGQAPALMQGHGGMTLNVLVGGGSSTGKTLNAYRVRTFADSPRLVQVGCIRDTAIQDVGKRLDCRSYKAHSFIFTKRSKEIKTY